MKIMELKIAQIGNSRGVRLPATSLRRYHFKKTVIMEERQDGILLRSAGPTVDKLSWADAACEMAASNETWSELDNVSGDGLEDVPWVYDKKSKIAEKPSQYKSNRRKGSRQ